jgi:hypothetical protein
VASPPTLDLFTASEFVTSTKMNELWTAHGFYLGSGTNPKPFFIGYRTGTGVTCTTATWTEIGLDTEGADSVNGHSTVTNNARYTPTIQGWYRVRGQGCFVSNATGVRGAWVRRNGTGVETCPYTMAQSGALGGEPGTPETHGFVFMNGTTDYLSLWVWQSSGGNLATTYIFNTTGLHLSAEWMHS